MIQNVTRRLSTPLFLVLLILLCLVAWEALIRITNLPPFLLPGPQRVLEALAKNRMLIAEHAAITLLETVLALVLGSFLGIVTALQLAFSPTARRLVQPLLVFSQAIPVFALAPIFTLWFGYGVASKVAVALFIIYFPMTSAFFDGLANTPKGFLDQAQVMGASRANLLWRVRIPAALPSLGSGLRLAAVYAPIGVVIGEWVGASRGLGYLMLLANGNVKTDLMFAALLVLALMSIGLHALTDRFARRFLRANQS